MHDTWKSATAALLSYYFSAALNRRLSALFAKSNTVQTLKYCKSGPKNPEIREKTHNLISAYLPPSLMFKSVIFLLCSYETYYLSSYES